MSRLRTLAPIRRRRILVGTDTDTDFSTIKPNIVFAEVVLDETHDEGKGNPFPLGNSDVHVVTGNSGNNPKEMKLPPTAEFGRGKTVVINKGAKSSVVKPVVTAGSGDIFADVGISGDLTAGDGDSVGFTSDGIGYWFVTS